MTVRNYNFIQNKACKGDKRNKSQKTENDRYVIEISYNHHI